MKRIDCPWSALYLRLLYEHGGKSFAQLAELADVSVGPVRRWLREAGIMPRDRYRCNRGGKIETRHCAVCGRSVTRYASCFVTPRDRTFCSRSCSTRYWRRFRA